MDIEGVCGIFIIILCIAVSIDYYVNFNLKVDKVKEELGNLYLKYSSSAHAGGSGMVFNEDGEISNSISALECEKRAEYYFNIPDSEIKKKVIINSINDGFITSIIITSIITFVIFVMNS